MKCFFELAIVLFLGCLLIDAEPVEASLALEDCQKCHQIEWQQISGSGMAHKEKVTCLDCHQNHRPFQADNTPHCTDCHGFTPHSGIADCSGCHQESDPCISCHMAHQPLVWVSNGIAAEHCEVCHRQAVELLAASTSKHSDLDCTFCHAEHREFKQCSDCHGQPHPVGTHQMFPQCGICHNIAHNLSPK